MARYKSKLLATPSLARWYAHALSLVTRSIFALLLAIVSTSVVAQSSSLLVSPALSRYLGLSSEQIKGLVVTEREWQAELSHARQQMQKNHDKSARLSLCSQLQERHAQIQTRAQSLLTNEQRTNVLRLRDMYAFMPLIESAQRVQLLSTDLQGSPSVLPDGAVDVDFRYVRSEIEPLPGCPMPASRPYSTQEKVLGVTPPSRQ